MSHENWTLNPLDPGRRALLERLFGVAAASGVSTVLGACGGGAAVEAGAPMPPAAGGPAPSPPPPAPPPPPPPPPTASSVARLKAALQRPALTYAEPQADVQDGAAQSVVSSFGSEALMAPPLVNPSQLSLATIPEVWGFRRDRWTRQSGAFIASWQVYPVSGTLCGLHFMFDGPAFEILFAGTDKGVTLIVDGQYLSRKYIRTALIAGVEGAPLANPNSVVRFDLGGAKVRKVSVYALSSQGPCAIAIPSGYRLQPWDRSDEASFCAMADSFGQTGAQNWGTGGPFWEAAALLGIPHLDINAHGGTGYAPNSVFTDPALAFGGRLAAVVGGQSDLFLTAGGINDNNWLALPPYASADDARAGFIAGVEAYYRDLRAALPESVIAAVGPWTPPRDPSPESVVQDKVDTIKRALQAIAGPPWIFLDNVAGNWINSSGASTPASGQRWLTGRGYEGSFVDDGGNSNGYISADGTHPNEAGTTYLAGKIAADLRAAILAL